MQILEQQFPLTLQDWPVVPHEQIFDWHIPVQHSALKPLNEQGCPSDLQQRVELEQHNPTRPLP